jgi:hypothetical protein
MRRYIFVVGSAALLTEEVAAWVVFCRESFPRLSGSRILGRIGYQIGREERRRVMPCLMYGTLRS